MQVSLLKRTFPIRQKVLDLKTPQSQACVNFCVKECLSFHGSILMLVLRASYLKNASRSEREVWGLRQTSDSVRTLQALFLTMCPPIRFPSKRPRGRHKRSIFQSWFEVDNDRFPRVFSFTTPALPPPRHTAAVPFSWWILTFAKCWHDKGEALLNFN